MKREELLRQLEEEQDARASIAAAPAVAELMACELGKGRVWQEAQVAGFCELARGYLVA